MVQDELIAEMKRQNERIIELLNESRPKEVQACYIRRVPDKWGVSVSAIGSTDSSNLDLDDPTIEIEIPDKVSRTVREISITGNADFIDNAKVFVYIDNAPIFKSKNYGIAKYSSGISLKFDNGFSIDPQKSVKIFAFTEDGDSIELSAYVRFGE